MAPFNLTYSMPARSISRFFCSMSHSFIDDLTPYVFIRIDIVPIPQSVSIISTYSHLEGSIL